MLGQPYSISQITTATPTPLTGLLKGNGASVALATAGTDYITPAELAAALPPAGTIENDVGNATLETYSVGAGLFGNIPALVLSPGLGIHKSGQAFEIHEISAPNLVVDVTCPSGALPSNVWGTMNSLTDGTESGYVGWQEADEVSISIIVDNGYNSVYPIVYIQGGPNQAAYLQQWSTCGGATTYIDCNANFFTNELTATSVTTDTLNVGSNNFIIDGNGVLCANTQNQVVPVYLFEYGYGWGKNGNYTSSQGLTAFSPNTSYASAVPDDNTGQFSILYSGSDAYHVLDSDNGGAIAAKGGSEGVPTEAPYYAFASGYTGGFTLNYNYNGYFTTSNWTLAYNGVLQTDPGSFTFPPYTWNISPQGLFSGSVAAANGINYTATPPAHNTGGVPKGTMYLSSSGGVWYLYVYTGAGGNSNWQRVALSTY